MINKKKWRRSKMFLSKGRFNLRFFYLMIFSMSLMSCSSLFGGSASGPVQGADARENVKKQVNEPTTADKTNTLGGSESGTKQVITDTPRFTGPDPMADIQINSEIKKAYGKVASLDSAKKYSEALAILSNIQTKYPQLSGPDYQMARIYFSQKKLKEALVSVNASLKNNQRNYYSLNLKGVILREQGDFDGAKNSYLKAIEIYPPYANSHLNLGVLADIYLRDLPLALIQYREYMRLTKNQDKKVANWVLEIERRIKAGG